MIADTASKRGLLRYERWILAFAAFGAGVAMAAVMAAFIALFNYV
jgi:hypothetical protein